MKEAIGNASVFNLVIIFLGIMIALIVASLNYTKAFKVKNSIVDFIEKYDAGYSDENRGVIDGQINEFLSQIGYRTNNGGVNSNCPNVDGAQNGGDAVNGTSVYNYCIYEFNSSRGNYYKVIAYMYFDIPLLSTVTIPVSGETEVFYFVEDQYRPNGG